jgi:hypothetical protein
MKSEAKLVRLNKEENDDLEQTARRLGLSVAELLRRSWRISARKFYKLAAPGAVRIEQGSKLGDSPQGDHNSEKRKA